jgi:hypothetical protein
MSYSAGLHRKPPEHSGGLARSAGGLPAPEGEAKDPQRGRRCPAYTEHVNATSWVSKPVITEMNRICLLLSDMNNRILGPYLAAIPRIIISRMCGEQ